MTTNNTEYLRRRPSCLIQQATTPSTPATPAGSCLIRNNRHCFLLLPSRTVATVTSILLLVSLLCIVLVTLPVQQLMLAEGCFATTQTPTPTTTTTTTTTQAAAAPITTSTSTTTTTTSTTTTTTANPCTLCSQNTITLTPGNGQTTVTPTTPGPQLGPNGCTILVVTCTGGAQVFMQFNTNQGGPLQPIGTGSITATLDCAANGDWIYNPGMGIPSRHIVEVNCQVTNGGRK